LIPFCSPAERYLMPYMPMYFVLWLFILNASYDVIKMEIKDRIFLRNVVYIVFASLIFIYLVTSCRQIDQYCRYYSDKSRQNQIWLQAASWIKRDSRGLPQRAKIMSFDSNYLSYLTDSGYIRLPYLIFDWDKVINFAVLKKVDYMVISGDYVGSFRSWLVFKTDKQAGRIKMIHEIKTAKDTFLIFRL